MIIGILAILLMALPLLTACGDDDETKEVTQVETQQPTPEEMPDIHVGMAGLVTGPYGAYAPITWGYLDYVRDLNERGGIDGAQIKMHWKDCQFDTSQSLAAYTDFARSSYDLVAFSGNGTEANLALSPRCNEDEISLIAIGGEQQIVWPSQKWVFGTTPNHGSGAVSAMKYAMDQWDGSAPPKVGIAYPAMAFGEAQLEGIEDYAEELGYQVVEKKEFALTSLDGVSQALTFQNAGVDIVYVAGTAKSVAVLCKDMKRQGFEPSMVIGPFHAIHPAFSDLAGDAGEGVIAWNVFEIWPQDMDNPSVGLSMGVTLEAGLREAAREVGAANIDAQAFRDALENITDFKTETSGFQPPITFTSENHEAYRSNNIMQVQNGEWVRVTDWFESPWEYTE
jgi:ABC-type branched-subunit amino acid transport system substrate-binding protein